MINYLIFQNLKLKKINYFICQFFLEKFFFRNVMDNNIHSESFLKFSLCAFWNIFLEKTNCLNFLVEFFYIIIRFINQNMQDLILRNFSNECWWLWPFYSFRKNINSFKFSNFDNPTIESFIKSKSLMRWFIIFCELTNSCDNLNFYNY